MAYINLKTDGPKERSHISKKSEVFGHFTALAYHNDVLYFKLKKETWHIKDGILQAYAGTLEISFANKRSECGIYELDYDNHNGGFELQFKNNYIGSIQIIDGKFSNVMTSWSKINLPD